MLYFWICLVSFLVALLFCVLGSYRKYECPLSEFFVCIFVFAISIFVSAGALEVDAVEVEQVIPYVGCESQSVQLSTFSLMYQLEEPSANLLRSDGFANTGVSEDDLNSDSFLEDSIVTDKEDVVLIPLDVEGSPENEEEIPMLDIEEMPIKDSLPAGSLPSISEDVSAIRQDLYLLVHGLIPFLIAVAVIIAGCYFFYKLFFDV